MPDETEAAAADSVDEPPKETTASPDSPTLAIPDQERSPSFPQFVHYFVDATANFKAANEGFPHQTNLFYSLVYPWVIDPAGDNEIETALESRRKELSDRGFDGLEAKQKLEQILAEDSHLRDCCATAAFLAYYLDTRFVGFASSLAEGQEEAYTLFFESFIKTTYSGPFRKQAVSHIFNFDADEARLEFEGLRVVKLDSATVSRLLGEPTFPSFIHAPGVGDFFVITEEGGPSDDVIKWLYDERSKAVEFASMLQYFKDGIIHVDYTVPHFFPLWVNDIRKRGIFFIGDPHRQAYANGNRPYRLDP